MSNLARYSGWNICHMIKTGKYVNLHCLTFQNLQTELKYHDHSSTICILKRTHFLSRKCQNLDVSDDVIRKIVASAKIFYNQNVSYIINSQCTKFHYSRTFVAEMPEGGGGGNPLTKKPGWNRVKIFFRLGSGVNSLIFRKWTTFIIQDMIFESVFSNQGFLKKKQPRNFVFRHTIQIDTVLVKNNGIWLKVTAKYYWLTSAYSPFIIRRHWLYISHFYLVAVTTDGQ